MSPESQELESFFQKIHEAEAPFQQAGTAEGGDRQMDQFFKQLSSIDDLVLNREQPAAPVAPVAPVAPAAPKAAAWPAPATPPRPVAAAAVKSPPRSGGRMRIFRSDRPQDDPFGAAAAAADSAGMSGKIMTACKVLAAGMLLFGVGLASGWAALSLPEKFGDSMAVVSERFYARKEITERAPTRVEFATPAGAPEGTSTEAAKPIATGPVEAPEQPGEPDATVAGIELPAAEMFEGAAPAKAKPASATAKAEPAPATAKAVPPAEATKGAGRFALQVGACHSPGCVKSYRELLLPHVKPDSIRVVESGAPGGQESVQRIRVISLTKDDARKLKQDLAAADARLKGAYLITTAKVPSS